MSVYGGGGGGGAGHLSHASTRVWMEETSATSHGTGREDIIFLRELPVKVKSGEDREAFICPLTVKLSVTGAQASSGFQVDRSA